MKLLHGPKYNLGAMVRKTKPSWAQAAKVVTIPSPYPHSLPMCKQIIRLIHYPHRLTRALQSGVTMFEGMKQISFVPIFFHIHPCYEKVGIIVLIDIHTLSGHRHVFGACTLKQAQTETEQL